MSKSTSILVNNIKQDLLKEDLLAKSFEEYKSQNDTIINSKPLVLNEFIDNNLQTEQVDDGHLVLDEIVHSEENNSAEILILKDYVEDHNKIEEVKTESAPITSVKSQSQNQVENVENKDEIIKLVNSLNKTTNDFKIVEGFEKFDTLDEATQFVKNHFQNDLQNFLNINKNQIDEICKKLLIK
jgi:hypothetical protein